LVKNFNFFHNPLHSSSPLGGIRRSIAKQLGVEKVEWCGYPKVKKFDDMLIRFDGIPACDRQTDGQTDGLHAIATLRYAYATRGKNEPRHYKCLLVVKALLGHSPHTNT